MDMLNRPALHAQGFTDEQIDAAIARREGAPPPSVPFHWSGADGTVTRYEHGKPPRVLPADEAAALVAEVEAEALADED